MAGKVKVSHNLDKAFSGKVSTGSLSVPVIAPPFLVPVGVEMGEGKEPQLDLEEVEASFEQRMRALDSQLIGALTTALTGALAAPVWDWKGGARDIFDTGKLASSLTITVGGSGLNVRYAAPSH